MNILIVGASGATGRLLVEQLLDRGHFVKVIVRSPDTLPEAIRQHDHLSVKLKLWHTRFKTLVRRAWQLQPMLLKSVMWNS